MTLYSTKNTWLIKTPRRLSKPLELREGLVLQSSIRGTTDFDSMRKRFYYVDHTPFEDLPRLIPKGPDDSIWLEPNDRAEKFGK